MISELEPPIPMLIYVLFCTITTFASRFLTKNEEAEAAMRELDESISQRSSFLNMFGSIQDKDEQDDLFVKGFTFND